MRYTVTAEYVIEECADPVAAAKLAWEALCDSAGHAPVVTVRGADGTQQDVDLEEEYRKACRKAGIPLDDNDWCRR